MSTDIAERIRKAAIINAVKHGGKAEVQSVLGNLLGDNPDLRAKAKDLFPIVRQTVADINALPQEELKKIASNEWPEEFEKEHVEEERKLPPLPNADRYSLIVTRIAPNPDFVLHIGNARAAVLSHDYARMYKGKFVVRFEDTDPRLKKAQLGYYDLIRQDLKWLGCEWDAEYIQSDRLERYYSVGKTLLEKNGAYICECQREAFHALVTASKSCPDRDLPVGIQLERWEKMLNGGYNEEEAVFRVRTELSHPNPAIRDWPAFRVIDTEKNPHPRVGSKYRVWPLYNLASGVDDHELGITHIIRGKEHLTNMARQLYLYHQMRWKYPEAIHYGRLKIEGMNLSKSRLMKGVETGEYSGIDDPRLGTIAALRRRGYVPETIRKLMWDIGPKPVDVTISWDNVNAINRKLIDPSSHRYYFVEDPVEATITGLSRDYLVHAPLHPQHPEMGQRTLTVHQRSGTASVYVSKPDLATLRAQKTVRLMGLFNFKPERTSNMSVEGKFEGDSAYPAHVPIIQWVPSDEKVLVKVVMSDGSVRDGYGEISLKSEPVGAEVQFVRFAFCRIDASADGMVTAYYTHE